MCESSTYPTIQYSHRFRKPKISNQNEGRVRYPSIYLFFIYFFINLVSPFAHLLFYSFPIKDISQLQTKRINAVNVHAYWPIGNIISNLISINLNLLFISSTITRKWCHKKTDSRVPIGERHPSLSIFIFNSLAITLNHLSPRPS